MRLEALIVWIPAPLYHPDLIRVALLRRTPDKDENLCRRR
jgi:hypothetical protein